MRLTIIYSIRRVPLDYRAAFAQLIREALRLADPGLFDDYETRYPIAKPFCFSVVFQKHTIKDAVIELEGYTNLDLSVLDFAEGKERGDKRASLALFNGLRSLKTAAFPFPLGEQLRRVQSQVLPEKMAPYFGSGRVRFKTLSPVVPMQEGRNGWHSITSPEMCEPFGSAGSTGDALIDLGAFTSGLTSSLKGRIEGPLVFEPINLKVEAVRHAYGDNSVLLDKPLTLSCFSGSFILEADPEDLYRIYQLGIGFKRDQGFGMLEVE